MLYAILKSVVSFVKKEKLPVLHAIYAIFPEMRDQLVCKGILNAEFCKDSYAVFRENFQKSFRDMMKTAARDCSDVSISKSDRSVTVYQMKVFLN